MVMAVSDLVNEALYLSVLDRESGPAPTDLEQAQGLRCLQGVLAEHALSIPYRQCDTFSDTKALLKTDFTEINAVNYLCGGQRYLLEGVGLHRWNRARTTTVHAMPEIYFFNPADTSIKVYPLPSRAGIFEVWGCKANTPMRITDMLDRSLPAVFLEYLKYLTAFSLCAENSIPWSNEKQARLEGLAASVTNQTVINTEAEPQYVYSSGVGYDANALFSGRGWRL
ncbi:hypothetical protein [Candidiatus Paracoxiella cheracis]|uniref:hypothetical protein n=1 Tax=Candidiatus Paracoxiella cheracis TaxID=3405120 RepID=UPI003BF465FD